MRRPMLYAIKGKVMTAFDISQECQCSTQTVYTWWRDTSGTDDEKFEALKKSLHSKNYQPGYVTLQQVAQKTHFNREMIYSFAKSKTGKMYQTEFRKDDNTIQPQIMLKTVELNDFITDLKRYAARNAARREKEAENKTRLSAIKTERLEDLKKSHPLVTDDRFFEESFFPNIDSYEILTECNYHRPPERK